MGWEAWITTGTLALVLILLGTTRLAPDLILLAGLTFLLTVGVLTVEDALAGLANEGLATIAVLFVVTAGLKETGGIDWLAQNILGRSRSVPVVQARIMLPVAVLSAFLNNTPIVAMMLPGIRDWAKKHQISSSKFLLPLSYAAILGGRCTLIGTSTNLVINGLLVTALDHPGMGMFEMAWIALPGTLVGLVYIMLVSHWLLPERKPALSETDDLREYTVEMTVEANSPLENKTIEEAGLRHLPRTFLMEIERADRLLPVVSPQEQLEAGDRLVFVGPVDSVKDLQKIRGLQPATNQVLKLKGPRYKRCLIEAVVSNTCPLIGMTIREGKFRTLYNGVVIAVARNGERIADKIGDIVLKQGDTLLLETNLWSVDQLKASRDFFLASHIEDSAPPSHDRAWVAVVILVGMVVAASAGWLSMLNAALLAAGLMVITRCCMAHVARNNIDWQLLSVIAAAFGLGRAMEVSGAAGTIAHVLIGLAGDNPISVLAVVYLITMLFSELITNNAAAVLAFPIALATADRLQVDVMPFVIAIMMAASSSFATPIGYQTNLMVYGPGGYRFSDYLRLGIPLDVLLAITTLALLPLMWPF